MITYTFYNAALATIMLPVVVGITAKGRRIADLLVAARISLLLALLAYPWDFFAIHLHAWRYVRDPGLLLYGVPLNDLAFIWICSMLTSSVLLAIVRRKSPSGRHSKREEAG